MARKKVKLTPKQQSYLEVVLASLDFINQQSDKILSEINHTDDKAELRACQIKLRKIAKRYDNELKNLLNWLNKEKLPITRDIKSLL